jgi:hypothetical protein
LNGFAVKNGLSKGKRLDVLETGVNDEFIQEVF